MPSDSAVDQLAGSILLERGEAGVVIATNLVVELKDWMIEGEDETLCIKYVQSRLVKRVESFCRQRGFWQIDFEVFAHETGEKPPQADLIMNVLLEADFELQSLRPSTYYPQDKYYIFSRKLPFSFFGDRGEHVELSRWLLEDHFQFASIDGPQNLSLEKGVCHCYTFYIPYSHPRFRIRGVSLVDLNYGEFSEFIAILTGKRNGLISDSHLRNALVEANVRVLITFRKFDEKFNDPHVWILDSARLEEILDPEIVSQPTGENVGGIVIELREDKLDERIRNKKPFGYYVASGLGDEIYYEFNDPDRAQRREFYVLIAAHQHQGPMVWGVARLRNIESYTPTAAYSGLPPEMRLWDLAQFEYYVNEFTSSYKQHETTYVLSLGHPIRLHRPIPYPELFAQSEDAQRDMDLEVTTRYVSKAKIDSLMTEFGDEFSDAKREEEFETADSVRADQLAARLATYLDVAKTHFPAWFPRQNEAHINSLRAQLIEPHRNSGANPTDDEVQDRSSSPTREHQRRLFQVSEPFFLTLAKLANNAWNDFRASNGNESNSINAWRVRILSGELVKAAESQLNVKKKVLDQLKEIFPTVAELRTRVQNKLKLRLLSIFEEDADPNSLRAKRVMIIEQDLKFPPNRVDRILSVQSNEVFVNELLRAIFNEPGTGHLIAISEAVAKKAIDPTEEATRHDITLALKAMKDVEDSLPSGDLP